MPQVYLASLNGIFALIRESKAQRMSKMEEEGAGKWTEEQMAETMMDLSGTFLI